MGLHFGLMLRGKPTGKSGDVDDCPFMRSFTDQFLFSPGRYLELHTPIINRRDFRSELDKRSDWSRSKMKDVDVRSYWYRGPVREKAACSASNTRARRPNRRGWPPSGAIRAWPCPAPPRIQGGFERLQSSGPGCS